MDLKRAINFIFYYFTIAPSPLNDCAEPLPTSPKPITEVILQSLHQSHALMLSTKDFRQTDKLSEKYLIVTESLTFIAGKGKAFCFLRK